MIKQRFDDEIVKGRTIWSTLPDRNILISKGNTVITLPNIHFLVLKNTAPVTVTSIMGGIDGMVLDILGDTFTTIQNNASIVTSTGANKLLNIHIYTFISYQNVWYEKA